MKLILLRTRCFGLVLQVGEAEKFPQSLGFESLDPLIRVSKQGACFTATEEDGGDERLTEFELLLVSLMTLHCRVRFSLTIAVIAEAILMRLLQSRCHPCTGWLPGT